MGKLSLEPIIRCWLTFYKRKGGDNDSEEEFDDDVSVHLLIEKDYRASKSL